MIVNDPATTTLNTIYSGYPWYQELQFMSNTTPINITNWDFAMQIRQICNSDAVVTVEITKSDASNGNIVMVANTTSVLVKGTAVGDLMVDDGSVQPPTMLMRARMPVIEPYTEPTA